MDTYQQTREKLMKIDPSLFEKAEDWTFKFALAGAKLSGANLKWADLKWANLSGANLSEANLKWADLKWANLSGANLRATILSGANLSGVNFKRADLTGANLNGITMSWNSHDLIAEIIFRAAGSDIAKRKIAGLVLMSRDWCWEEFLKIKDPLKEWALFELANYLKDGDDAPDILRRTLNNKVIVTMS